jgi:hypothetical protein
MKYLLLAVLLLMQDKTRFGQATKPAEYSIPVHVKTSRLINECVTATSGSNCGYAQHLTAVIGGKEYELERFQVNNVLRVGDYKAALIEDKHPRAEEYSQVYEFLFSDKKTAKFDVVGESE